MACQRCYDWVKAGCPEDDTRECELHLAECPTCWTRHETLLRAHSDKTKDWAKTEFGVTVEPLEDVVVSHQVHTSDSSVLFKGWLCEGQKRRLVALKCAKAGLYGAALLRFQPEFHLHSRLKLDVLPEFIGPAGLEVIPGILQPPQTYILTEWIEGSRVDEHPDWRGGESQRIHLFARVCGASGDLHAEGLVHRDIKPSHIFVAQSGSVKILDLGVARRLCETGPGITRPGDIQPGTPRYMAPEQFDPSKYGITDPSTDVWALGVMLFECLAGKHPFSESDTQEAYQTGTLQRMPRWGLLPQETSRSLRDVMEIAISRNPYDRYADGNAMSRALDACTKGISRPAKVRRWWQNQQRSPVRVSATFVSLGLLAGVVASLIPAVYVGRHGGGWLVDRRKEPPKAQVAYNVQSTREQIYVFEVDDSAETLFPAYASEKLNLGDVTSSPKTWRPIAGHLLDKLRIARPRAVILDLVFPDNALNPQHDEILAQAIRGISERGIPVVLATLGFSGGEPIMAERIRRELSPLVTCGLSLVRFPWTFPGQYLLAAEVDGTWKPGVFVSAYAAILNPARPFGVSWNAGRKTLQITFDGPSYDGISAPECPWYSGGAHELEGEAMPLTRSGREWASIIGKADLERTGSRTVKVRSIKTLLEANAPQLEDYAGKVILIGDVRTNSGDRHPTGSGVYVVADAIADLLADRYQVRLFHPDWVAWITYPLGTLLGLACGFLYYRAHRLALLRSNWALLGTLATLAIAAVFFLQCSFTPHGRASAHLAAAMVGVSFTAWCAIAILNTKQRQEYRRVASRTP